MCHTLLYISRFTHTHTHTHVYHVGLQICRRKKPSPHSRRFVRSVSLSTLNVRSGCFLRAETRQGLLELKIYSFTSSLSVNTLIVRKQWTDIAAQCLLCDLGLSCVIRREPCRLAVEKFSGITITTARTQWSKLHLLSSSFPVSGGHNRSLASVR